MSKKKDMARMKRAVRPIVEKWFSEMRAKDKKFKMTQPNEINKVVNHAARKLLRRG